MSFSDDYHKQARGRLSRQERLLDVLAEQMKLPLMQIARLAELNQIKANGWPASLADIELTADSALRLLDSYILSTKLARAQNYLQLEPVSVSAVLHDTAHQLSKLASQHDCELELHLAGRYEPVLAHRAGLEAALTSLGYVFIEAQASSEHRQRPVVKLAAHRSRTGIVAGLFSSGDGLSATLFRRGRGLYGQSRQPLANLTAASGAGIFVADSLLTSMSTRLRLAHHQKLTGLAATLLPSHQMVLV
ncbi:MAG: hypothetical protein ACXWLH_01565 [Candidatus Saccharimonadales bacterium]